MQTLDTHVRITGERNTFTGQSRISIIYDLVLWTIVVAQEKQLPANFLHGTEVLDNIVCEKNTHDSLNWNLKSFCLKL